MRREFLLCFVLFACFGGQANGLAQTFLPDAETKVSYEVGKPMVHLVIHPVIGTGHAPVVGFDPAFAEYDIFATTNGAADLSILNPNDWLWVRRTLPGETNMLVKNVWSKQPKFVFASIGDADNDGLPDTFEILVSKTNPLKYDSANDGIADGDRMGPNGLPWSLEQSRQTHVVVYANANKAVQGGACGQCTIFLPAPAPDGGETVQYYLGGFASPERDFTISPAGGSWNHYSLKIPSGAVSEKISFCAIKREKPSSYHRYLVVNLTSAKDFPVAGVPAEVDIVESR